MDMKKLKYILFSVFIWCLCIFPLAGMPFCRAEEPASNETQAKWPSLYTEGGGYNRFWLRELGEYFEDHFALRAYMLTAHSVICKDLFHVSPNEDVICGENNWLYYSASLDDYQHKTAMSDRRLFIAAHNLRMIQDSLEGQGKQFLFTVAPDKSTLYGMNMPARYQFTYAARSDFDRLEDYLEGEGVHYVDLESIFRRSGEILYYERDSHWNERGAVLAYNALLDAAGKSHETYDDMQPAVTMDRYGDLGLMLYPAGLYPEPQEHFVEKPLYGYVTPTQSVEEDYIRTENPDREGRLLMYRDSFGNSLLPLMAQEFSEAAFSKVVPYELALAEDAELVILEKVERHLPSLALVVPLMWGPERDLPGSGTAMEILGNGISDLQPAQVTGEDVNRQADAGSRIHVHSDRGFYEITGTADDQSVCVDSRFLLSVTDHESTRCYEAFLQGTDSSDYAFCLYLPENAVAGSILEICLFLQNSAECRMIASLQSEDHDAFMAAKAASEQALRSRLGDVSDQTAQVLISALEEMQDTAEDTAEKTSPQGQAEGMTDSGAGPAAGEISRQYIEDCGKNTGYWDILYDDGHHEYRDTESDIMDIEDDGTDTKFQ